MIAPDSYGRGFYFLFAVGRVPYSLACPENISPLWLQRC
jgi:hypothetical protein